MRCDIRHMHCSRHPSAVSLINAFKSDCNYISLSGDIGLSWPNINRLSSSFSSVYV